MKMLPVVPAHQLVSICEQQRWLIEGLWAEQAVGIVGGEPKSFKTFLALDMAVAVASGAPCLGHFRIPSPGRVVLYAAEDSPATVRERLEGISLAAGRALPELDIQVITAPTLRLDLTDDCQKLTATVAQLRPRLLILDPFVRLHRKSENDSSEVAPLLAYLRELQRQYQVAVTVVHHARKGADGARAGQALRGSSEFHAWGDSNLYLRRRSERLVLTVEHRAAAAMADLAVSLCTGPGLALRAVAEPAAPEPAAASSLPDKVEAVLAQSPQPLRFAELRQACRIRTARLCSVLDEMARQGRVHKTPAGYSLVTAA
ncbi:MAG: AAA family ATPase [Candidatus Rokubacteria bacterium]|nr:AAA family ATPase [Candidatus Rokubacteria bacterium]